MRVLITGIQGFIGRHLARYLAANGCEVSGLDRTSHASSDDGSQLTCYVCDINDRSTLARMLDETRPDAPSAGDLAVVCADACAAALALDPARLERRHDLLRRMRGRACAADQPCGQEHPTRASHVS